MTMSGEDRLQIMDYSDVFSVLVFFVAFVHIMLFEFNKQNTTVFSNILIIIMT